MFDFTYLWVAIIGFGLLMYVLADGFDLGVGMLFPFAADEDERDVMMNSVAPVWDGNETWLVLDATVGQNAISQTEAFRHAAGITGLVMTKLDGTAIAKDSKEYSLTTLDFLIYGGDGYLNVFSPSQAKVKGALLDIFVDALKADMAAGKVTQVPAADGRITKVG